ncbi:dUTPase [Simiduia litorea]|uniref:dUTP diphosphatase n=1 Tax=Simiduia litorea TaxID=1435348 RepID=UPI0036F3908B
MRAQLKTMLELQDSMNTKVNDKWREQNFAWYRAIWVECAELMDHFGWKWWKKQVPDVEQVRLELIDIWHFGLSISLTKFSTQALMIDELEQGLKSMSGVQAVADDETFRQLLEVFAEETIASKSFSVSTFAKLLSAVDMNFDRLYCGYVGKNVLNFFRQDHGYKDGSYKKLWSGREDNEHLVEAVAELDTDSASFADDLYQTLLKRYENA